MEALQIMLGMVLESWKKLQKKSILGNGRITRDKDGEKSIILMDKWCLTETFKMEDFCKIAQRLTD